MSKQTSAGVVAAVVEEVEVDSTSSSDTEGDVELAGKDSGFR